MPTFDAVFFDIGSTLISSAAIIRRAATTACRRLARAGLIPNARDFLRSYLLADAQCNAPHLSHIYSDARLVENAAQLAGLPADLRRVTFFLCAFREAMRMQIRPSPILSRLFGDLDKAGIKRGIISDGSTTGQSEVLMRLALLPAVSPGLLLISQAVGYTKDNAEIYRRALAAAGVPAQRALMIGDRIDLDVAVPQSVGMKAVLLLAHAAPAFVPAGLAEKGAAVQPDGIFQNWRELVSWLKKAMQR